MVEPYKILILSPIDYIKKQLAETEKPLEWVGYPKILRTGYCSHKNREIVLCKGLANIRTVYHEIGHELGKKHVAERENIMYPYINRGIIGIGEIAEEYAKKYGYEAWACLIRSFMEL